ncbi:hypothetical protein C8R46DRAFT_1088202 [Mycena filopes]|nr:hypothetical protein C8R46DRAFT_1088202 [Mycena filopes]
MLGPFELSGLVALSIGDPRRPFVESLPRLRLLDLSVTDNHQPINLALLPQLEVLCIFIGGICGVVNAMVLATLSSVRPACAIRDISIYMGQFSGYDGRNELDLTLCADLDLVLSGLPLAHPYTVAVEISQSDHDVHASDSYFPRLKSSNRLILRDGYSDWFENLTRTLQ